MLKDQWLPSSRHIKELIKFSEEVSEKNTSSSKGISLILIDNAAELLLREYQRFYLRKPTEKVKLLSFKKLIENSTQLQTMQNNATIFDFNHEMRNAIYHSGQLNPVKKDVKSAISYTKDLFNELHSNHKFKKIIRTLPTKTSATIMQKIHHGLYTEIYFSTLFSEHFKKLGYKTLTEPRIDNRYQADMVLTKGNKQIILEFKSSPLSINFDKLRSYGLIFENYKRLHPNLKVDFWLITQGIFPNSFIEESKKIGITLIDDRNIKDFVSGSVKCSNCGKTKNLQISHIVPLQRGGKTGISNLEILCSRCNAKKRN